MNLHKIAPVFFFLTIALSCASASAAPNRPCERDLELYCSQYYFGEGRTFACLQQYESYLSDECKQFLKNEGSTLQEIQVKCGNDAIQWCRDVRISYQRTMNCLEEHYNDVSHECRALLRKP